MAQLNTTINHAGHVDEIWLSSADRRLLPGLPRHEESAPA